MDNETAGPSGLQINQIPNNSENPQTKPKFQCIECNLMESYEYFGTEPPFVTYLTFNEPCYVLKDPFSAPQYKQIIILGSNCSKCSRPVCKSTQCSIYFAKTFCLRCAQETIESFPEHIQNKLQKHR